MILKRFSRSAIYSSDFRANPLAPFVEIDSGDIGLVPVSNVEASCLSTANSGLSGTGCVAIGTVSHKPGVNSVSNRKRLLQMPSDCRSASGVARVVNS